MSLPILTGVGRLTEDPALKFTPAGKAVVTLRLAFSDRRKNDQGVWEDGDKAYIDANVWGDEAERIAESLQRGHEVMVSGKFKQREYEARDGSKRVVYELAFATVAPTLKFATVKVAKLQRSGGARQQESGSGGFDDPWSTASPAPGSSVADSEVPF